MASEVTTSQRSVMKRAAKLANQLMRDELTNPDSPIRQCYEDVSWGFNWNPLVADWNARSGFGLRVRETDSFALSKSAAQRRIREITTYSIQETMLDKPTAWVGPMLRDLFSSDPFYKTQ